MLRKELEEAARRLPGCEAAALVGQDGILVDHWETGNGISLEVLAAELTPLLRALRSLSQNTEAGEVRGIHLEFDSWRCLVQPVNDEIILVMVAGKAAIPGRLRFEAARAASRLEAELG